MSHSTDRYMAALEDETAEQTPPVCTNHAG